MSGEKIVVGLSGGVDSSVAATILHNQGYDVVGLTLWLMKGKGQCCSEGMVDAATICQQLGLPHHIVDARDLFQENIINYLVTGYQEGITPSPCSQCNRAVKFGPMLQWAKNQLDVTKIATGHYARISYEPVSDRYQLKRAVDRNKDQSYFLYDLSQIILSSCVFPLGELHKSETRAIANQYNLSTANKPESQDLCLVESHGSMQTFLEKYIAPKPGDIVDTKGKVLGQHQGIHNYTVGQRKGLGLAAAHPLYVVAIDPKKNQVIVGSRAEVSEHEFYVKNVNWVSINPPTAPISAEIQVRYRTEPVIGTVIPMENNQVKIIFDEPIFGITPGQAAVWYDGEILLGGGIIEKAIALENPANQSLGVSQPEQINS
jgi:tRNA-specific 2-thiouridylase